MPTFISNRTALKLKILAWYQILGGIYGIIVSFWSPAYKGEITGLIIILFVIGLSLYGFSIYCGRSLLSDRYALGIKLSVVNNILQILSFSMLGYGFMYVSGSMLLGEMRFDHGWKFNLNFLLTSTWRISVSTDDTNFQLGINFIAIYWIWFIQKLQAQLKKEAAMHEEKVNAVPMTDSPPDITK